MMLVPALLAQSSTNIDCLDIRHGDKRVDDPGSYPSGCVKGASALDAAVQRHGVCVRTNIH